MLADLAELFELSVANSTNSTAELSRIYENTKPEALRNSNTYNVHNSRAHGVVSPKVREAGARTFVDYSLSQEIVEWMNASVAALGLTGAASNVECH